MLSSPPLRRTCLAGALIAAAALPAAAADRIDAYLAKQMREQHVPGLAVGVVREGRTLLARGYGVADVKAQARVSPETLFELASLSKPFVATAVMMLVGEGRVRLDDPVAAHVRELPRAWRSVTVRQALSHTSGLPDYLEHDDFDWNGEYDARKAIRLAAAEPADPPGRSYAYSNTNFLLMGLLLETLEGEPYGDVLRARVFRPLHMRDTAVNDLAQGPRRTRGYVWDDELQDRDPMSPSVAGLADGGLVSTVLDLARFAAALDADEPLPAAAQRQMWSPQRLRRGRSTEYGLGWALWREDGRRLVGHDGSVPGFSTALTRDVRRKLTVVVLCNLGDVDASELAEGVLERVPD